MKRLTALVVSAIMVVLLHPGSARAVAATEVSGVVTINVTIYLSTAIPTGDSVGCAASIGSGDAEGENTETKEMFATVSGSTATCVLVIPYYWLLQTPGTDVMSVSYSASILPTTGTYTEQSLVRTGSHTLPPIQGVPASGSHTNFYVATRL